MTINEDLISFFKTGSLKQIKFGITRDELTATLGETSWQHFTSRKDQFPSIYKYGRLEFYFDNTQDAPLHGIMFQPIPLRADNKNLKCKYHGLNRDTDLKTVINLLSRHNINFEEKPYEWDKDTILLLTEGGVSLIFDDQSNQKGTIHKVWKFTNY